MKTTQKAVAECAPADGQLYRRGTAMAGRSSVSGSGWAARGVLGAAWAAALAVAALLLLCATALPAQQTNAAPQDAGAQSGALAGGAAAGAVEAEAPDTNSSAAGGGAAGQPPQAEKRPGLDREAVVVIGRDAELKAGETADVVVVIGGSAKVHGKVREGVVVIGGDVEVDGDVGDVVVAVLGSVRVGRGAELHQDVVAVMGAIKVEPKATIHGDVVAVAGRLDVAEGASVKGHTQEVGINLEWLKKWLLQCVFKLRPLAPQVGWVWVVAGAFFLFYLLVAAAFPRPVQACVDVLNERPATTMVLGLVAKLLVPIVSLILVVTVIGMLVLPFVGLAVFFGVIVGKVALLEWVGLRIGQHSGIVALQKPLVAFVLGSVILTLFYMVWVVGLLAYLWFSIWGLGVAVTAVIGHLRRRRTAEHLAATQPAAAGPAPAVAGLAGMGDAQASAPQPASAAPPPGLTMPLAPAAVPEALSYPRAGFWERMGAAFLDSVLLLIADALVHGWPWGFLVALAYFAGMWAWKGTTIGGIVLGLKVVRLDGQPLPFTVALVRALAAAFSIIVLFLGFLWIAWDAEKQGWHDRIAGTVVVRLPRGTPLLCA
ncbi:MAG: RDD family protein [Verrucomicrobiota bacterium]|jgi:uncharacterized RDD family membrane protein YckC/cytoskeletal protein CcmA (bactofilin family)